MIRPPRIDGRDSRDLVAQLRTLLRRYTPEWPDSAEEKQLVEAMIHVFARFGEIVIDRLNRVPEKNFLAFLQLLGVSNLRPRAATAPLTFYLAGEGADFALVPAQTQVAAQPLKGEKDPVLFEMDRDLVVVATRFTSLFVKDGAHDLYSDLSHILPQAPPVQAAVMSDPGPGLPMFTGDTPIPHRFYIGLSVASQSSRIDRLVLKFGLTERDPGAGKLAVEWALCIPPMPKAPLVRSENGVPEGIPSYAVLASAARLRPTGDTTESFNKSGEVVFENVPPSPVRTPGGEEQYWLECSLLTRIAVDTSDNKAMKVEGEIFPADLLQIKSVSAAVEVDRDGLNVDQAFFNTTKLDLSKDFYPFGERPKFGDTLYLGSKELFSSQDAAVVLNVEMTNPAGAGSESPVPPVAPEKVKLMWEFWDGSEWRYLGTSGESAKIRIYDHEGVAALPDSFTDKTSAFSEYGAVSFQFPAPPAPTKVNGQMNSWVRVRIVSGNYGQEVHRQKELIGSATVAANFAPPVIRSIKAGYKFHRELQPPSLLAYNDFAYRIFDLAIDLGNTNAGPIQPFEPVAAEDAKPALYFGFEPPLSKARAAATTEALKPASFPSRSMCIYLDVEQSTDCVSTQDAASFLQRVSWEYWNGTTWVKWTVRDETSGFRHPGLMRFLAPSDFTASSRFGCTCNWLRAIPTSTEYGPKIRIALLNTAMATGGTTIRNELPGVSNGMPLQSFRLLHTPVLAGQQLAILEPRMPGRVEQEAIRRMEGDDAIEPVSQVAGHEAVWVRWHEVADYYASGPRDRHYVLDPISGAVSFGDGDKGQIPPRGGSVRANYRFGGGAAGNRPAWNITQLKTAVPYIGKVCNWIPAGAGGDAEDNQALLERGSRAARHGGRAVTLQDYEDLARLATPQVARAKCVPLFDLAAEPAGKHRRPGVVSVIAVPRSDDPRPMPGSELLECVLDYLRSSSVPTAQISVVAPDYVHIDVTTEIVVEDPDSASQVELAVKLALTAFLHPLTGGPGGAGWDFGRMPRKSDFFVVIEGVPGVSYVRDVSFFAVAEREDVEQTDRFLVSPGEIAVVPSLDPEETIAGALAGKGGA